MSALTRWVSSEKFSRFLIQGGKRGGKSKTFHQSRIELFRFKSQGYRATREWYAPSLGLSRVVKSGNKMSCGQRDERSKDLQEAKSLPTIQRLGQPNARREERGISCLFLFENVRFQIQLFRQPFCLLSNAFQIQVRAADENAVLISFDSQVRFTKEYRVGVFP